MPVVMVNHDYPHANDMCVVDKTNVPIEGVVIKIFDHTDFFAGLISTWVAETISDVDGKWVDPILLDAGRSWVVYFEKATMYGPKHIEITT